MDTEIVVPEGTKIKARFVRGERIRHMEKGTKTQWTTWWKVIEGPYTNALVKRVFWDTDNAIKILRSDCWSLDIGHPEELCMGPIPDIVIEGTASGDELRWLDHRVFPKRPPETVREYGPPPSQGKEPF